MLTSTADTADKQVANSPNSLMLQVTLQLQAKTTPDTRSPQACYEVDTALRKPHLVVSCAQVEKVDLTSVTTGPLMISGFIALWSLIAYEPFGLQFGITYTDCVRFPLQYETLAYCSRQSGLFDCQATSGNPRQRSSVSVTGIVTCKHWRLCLQLRQQHRRLRTTACSLTAKRQSSWLEGLHLKMYAPEAMAPSAPSLALYHRMLMFSSVLRLPWRSPEMAPPSITSCGVSPAAAGGSNPGSRPAACRCDVAATPKPPVPAGLMWNVAALHHEHVKNSVAS